MPMTVSQVRERLEDAIEDAGKFLMRCAGPIYVLAGNAAILFIGTTMYVVVFPNLGFESWFDSGVHIATLGFLLFQVLVNYFCCIRDGPGYATERADDVDPIQANGRAIRLCKKCGTVKPPRCHHCSICNRCVLGMDHHCPWMNSCIGRKNYKYFLRFLIFVWVGTPYTASMSYVPVRLVGFDFRFRKKDSVVQIGCMLLSVSIFVAISLLLSLHLVLSLAGWTTLECMEDFCDARTTPAFFYSLVRRFRGRNLLAALGWERHRPRPTAAAPSHRSARREETAKLIDRANNV